MEISKEEIESYSKVAEPSSINSTLIFWCELCTQNITITKKDETGNFAPQNICPHIILKKAY